MGRVDFQTAMLNYKVSYNGKFIETDGYAKKVPKSYKNSALRYTGNTVYRDKLS